VLFRHGDEREVPGRWRLLHLALAPGFRRLQGHDRVQGQGFDATMIKKKFGQIFFKVRALPLSKTLAFLWISGWLKRKYVLRWKFKDLQFKKIYLAPVLRFQYITVPDPLFIVTSSDLSYAPTYGYASSWKTQRRVFLKKVRH
jgi:hypothetical protein